MPLDRPPSVPRRLAAAVLIASLVAPLVTSGRVLADTPAAAAAFMRQKAAEPGVVTLPSGLEYKVVQSGDAAGRHPAATDSVLVSYVGKLSDGAIFDDSKGQVATLALDRVIKGWTEGLQLMRPGDVWTLYIPPGLAYGPRGAGPIPENAALVFRIELVGIADR